MKKLAVILAAAAVVLVSMQVFADDGGGKSIFQSMYDAMNVPCKAPAKSESADVKEAKKEIEAVKKVQIFQNMADGIKEGSAKAKQMSLRTRTK
ncbi:MAG: hypothetical protein WC592_00560 [Candidatus Omnitrophota bacterium]|nr:hypothetical protein [Candidatus Omnitrophota bacterium]